ncbi:IPTL-CTERM sorting domain-containing protein [Candidatus Kapabacteria bacterium]|nr:IPTL-CTERM sorting domain-containing protein [Candidatus Kapabacteria bacterium]
MKRIYSKLSSASELLQQYKVTKSNLKLKTKLRDLISLNVKMKSIYYRLKNLAKSMKMSLAALVLMIGTQSVIYANSPTFNAKVANPFNLTLSDQVSNYDGPAFADLDGDGDIDLLVMNYDNNKGNFQYFENIGTSDSPDFAAPKSNTFGFLAKDTDYGNNSAFVDLDDDGDFDFMLGEIAGAFEYYENTGTDKLPSFASPKTNTFGITAFPPNTYAGGITFADLDKDGDFDLMAGEGSGSFYYYENIGTDKLPSFASPKTNTFGIVQVPNTTYYNSPAFIDIDNDGDLDLFTGARYANIVFYENVGTANSPSFGSPITNTFGFSGNPPNTLYSRMSTGDLDGDGDLDILISEGSDTFQYYENVTPATEGPVEIADLGADQINPTSARINMNLTTGGSDATFTFEYGTATGNYSLSYSNTVTAVPNQVNVEYEDSQNLTANTEYFLRASATNSAGSFTVSDETSFWTLVSEPVNHSAYLRQVGTDVDKITLEYESLATTNSASYLLIRTNDATLSSSDFPVDGNEYSLNDNIGNSTVVEIISDLNKTNSTLSYGKDLTFRFALIPFATGNNQATANYLTNNAPEVTGFTIPTLGEWGMYSFMCLMLIGGVWQLRRI